MTNHPRRRKPFPPAPPEELRELAAELPEGSGIRAALLHDAARQESGDTSPVVYEYVR